MLSNKFFPYSSMQEINLDWILTKIKNILRFVPDDGAVGQILRRTAHGAEWSNEQGGGGAVTSVNGQTGDVVLAIPSSTSELVNDSGFVDAAGAAAAAPVQKVNGQTGTVTINKTSVGLGNVQNVLQYSASNPPPYPVTSVNGQTGAVSLSIPTDTSDLTNTAGFVNAAGAAAAAPVQSVNGQTGAVTVPAYNEYLQSGDVIYIRSSYRPGCCFTTSCSVIIPLIKRIAAGTTFTVSINGQVYVRLNGAALSNVSYREIEYRDDSNELTVSFNLTGGTNYIPCIVSFEATITVN